MSFIVKKISMLLSIITCFNFAQGQNEGDKKKVQLELVKIITTKGLAQFIDLSTKDTIEYDYLFMQKENPKQFEAAQNQVNEIFGYCMFVDNDCGFYGQKYIAEVVYKKVQKLKIYDGKDWVFPPKKNMWVITTLNRDLSNSLASLVYVSLTDPTDEDKVTKQNVIFLVVGRFSYAIDTISAGPNKLKRSSGSSLAHLEYFDEINFRFQGEIIRHRDRRRYHLTQKTDGNANRSYYELLITKNERNGIQSKKVYKYDMDGREIVK